MNSKNVLWILALVTVVSVAMSACSGSFEQNADKSWTVSVETDEASIQQAIDEAIDDPLVRGVTLDLGDGYLTVRAEKDHPDGSGTDSLAFRLDLGVAEGHLTVTASEVRFNGAPVDETQVDRWNERMADRLERGSKRHPNSTLESLTIGSDAITMVWRVEPRR